MSTIALHRSQLTVDQIIRSQSHHMACEWTDLEFGDEPSEARASRLVDMIAELTSAVLDRFEGHAFVTEALIAKLARFTAAAIQTRSLTHVDELLDDLYTMSINGMSTGDHEIDSLLAAASCTN